MNWELIKHKFCRLVVTASLLLGGVMVSAAASGTMPLWAALLGLFAAVVMLNAACGILLGTPAAEPRRLPDGKWLRLYHELGGELITLGSDAHTPEYISCAMEESPPWRPSA